MKKSLVINLILAIVPLTYNACGQTPFGAMGMVAELSSSSQGESGAFSQTDIDINKNPYALLSAEQVLKSMSSVTEIQPNGAIMTEYNARNTVLAPNNKLTEATPPMLIAFSNLAGTFCEETLNREVAQAASARKIYSSLNFATGISGVSDAQYSDSVTKLARSFWGRAPASSEMTNIMVAKTEFNEALSATERTQAASSRNLMLFTCTALLASFDSYTF